MKGQPLKTVPGLFKTQNLLQLELALVRGSRDTKSHLINSLINELDCLRSKTAFVRSRLLEIIASILQVIKRASHVRLVNAC